MTAFIHTEHEIGWPPDPVLRVLRDRTARLAAYLPHVDRVEELSRVDGADGVETVRRWWLLHDHLPAPLRAVVHRPALAFVERVAWGPTARFEIAPPVVPEAVDFAGDLALSGDDMDTLVVVRATFTLHASRVALPPSLADLGVATIEDLAATVAGTNLAALCRAVEAMLDDEV